MKAAGIAESSWYCPVMTSGPQSFHSKANKKDVLPLNAAESGMVFLKAFNLGKRD